MNAATATTESSSEPKRVIVLFGSPHRHGHTGALADRLLAALPDGTACTFFDAYRERPEPCVDCRVCEEQDGCALHDLDEFMETFERADAVVIATPVYYGFFPAPLKALIDRFQRYFSARFVRRIIPPIAKPKRAVLIATCGSDEPDGFSMLERETRRAFTVLHTRLCGTLFVGRTDTVPLEEDVFRQAERLAERLTGA